MGKVRDFRPNAKKLQSDFFNGSQKCTPWNVFEVSVDLSNGTGKTKKRFKILGKFIKKNYFSQRTHNVFFWSPHKGVSNYAW